MESVWGDGSVSESLVKKIYEILPPNKTVLELGSGAGSTPALAKCYKVFSVEHDEEWVGKYDSEYIHIPLIKHKQIKNHKGDLWYNAKLLKEKIPDKYDLLLVDGPPYSRAGLVKYWSMFRDDVIVVFDDVNRERDRKVTHSIAAKLKKPYTVYDAHTEKPFAVIER
jgi:predicted O-methyltransferase YrrM